MRHLLYVSMCLFVNAASGEFVSPSSVDEVRERISAQIAPDGHLPLEDTHDPDSNICGFAHDATIPLVAGPK